MREKALLTLSGILLFLMIPYLVTICMNGTETALVARLPDVESCVPLAASRQISGDLEEETVKAQTVIARTNLCRRLREEDIRDILGEMRSSLRNVYGYWQIPSAVYEKAADETEGQVLVYGGELKLVPYHEISSGRTRDGAEVFHDEAYAYLQPVDSSADKDSSDYLSSTYIARQQMPAELTIGGRDEAGYVAFLLADGDVLEGEAFRKGMGLSSSNFQIQEIGSRLRFLCKGRGHGLGFSQNGGEAMAKEGSTYQEILETYFPSMELEHMGGIFEKK